MKKIILRASLLICGILLNFAVVNIEAQTVVINDSNLKACIETELGTTNIDSLEMSNITRLDCRNMQINDLSGLEYAPNLQYLNLSGNQINDITVLSGLTNLSYVQLYDNQINDLSSLSKHQKLRQLLVDNNKITSLEPLKNVDSLMILSVNDNSISSLTPIASLTNLRELNIINNNVRTLAPTSGLENLDTLRTENNKLVDVKTLASNSNLKILYLDNNQIESLEGLENLSNLSTLSVQGNKLTSLKELKNLTNLKILNVSNNMISDLSDLKRLGSTKIKATSQTISAKSIQTKSEDSIVHIVIDNTGKNYKVTMPISKVGTNLTSGTWNVSMQNLNFSGTINQEITYKPSSKLTGLERKQIYEENVYTDAMLINLFAIKNDSFKQINVDQSNVDYSKPGKYVVAFSDEDNNHIEATLVIVDLKPQISSSTEVITIMLGESFDQFISVYNISATEIKENDLRSQVKVDSSDVDFTKEGEYNIVFSVVDEEGNEDCLVVKLKVARRKVTIDDAAGARINLYKTNLAGIGMPGFEYTIYDKEGNIVDVITTDASGHAQSIVLPPGEYYIEQTNTPKDRVITRDRLSVTETVSITFNNHDLEQENNSEKVSKEKQNKEVQSKTLDSKITIQVEIENDDTEIGVYLITDDGSIVGYQRSAESRINFENVKPGEYKVILDDLSSESYMLSADYNVIVTAEDEVVSISISVEKYQRSYTSYIIITLICLSLLSTFVLYNKKKFKR